MSSRTRRRHPLARLNPFARKTRKPAAELARAAGGRRQDMLEHLEQRQMLFTLTIAAPDPGLNVGTVQAFFGYVMPYFAPTIAPGTAPPTAVFEDFDTDDPAPPLANIPDDFIFDQSNLRLDYTPGQLSAARLVLEAGAQQGENEVEFVMQQGENFSFRVAFGDQGAAANNFIRFLTPSAITMEIGGTFDPNVVTVELRLQGQVVASFTGGALFALSQPVAAGIRQYSFAVPSGSFDEIHFVATGGPTGPFRVDNVGFSVPAGNNGPLVDGRIVGATIVFTGPVGASITVLDLYGRDMALTLALGIPAGSNTQIPIVDPNDDGIPDFNDGIGSIIITGTDRDSAITMWGGEIESFTGNPPANAEFTQNGFAFLLEDTIVGNFDDLEQMGFGYSATPTGNGTFRVTGLPPGPGSLVIGSPFVRPQGAYNPGGIAGGGANFNRADQGIFVIGNAPISSVYIHGIVHGASVFTSYVDRIVTGYMVGSVAVNGDLGFFTSGSDAGMWVDDDGAPYVPTGAILTVGRTLGEFATAGRNLMSVTVVGDLNNPASRPPRDVLRYSEHEYPTGQLPPTTQLGMIRNILANNNAQGFNRAFADLAIFFDRVDQALAFGTGTFRNDAILSAEWIGSIATSVQINGDLRFRDPVNNPDQADVFAFPVDGTQEVLFQLDASRAGGLIPTFMRVVDQDGRTLASTQVAVTTDEFISMRFRPTQQGVYYLVVAGDVTQNYVINISGMAATTFGSYRTGGGSGRNILGTNAIQVLSGSMGAMRVGTGFVDGTGAEVDPGATFNVVPEQVDNTDDEADEYMALRAMTVSVPGNLYTITTGSDIQDNQGLTTSFSLNVGGNLGTVITGLSPIPGTGPTEGDLRWVNMTIGGSVGMFDIRGGMGIDQDTPGAPLDPPDTVVIRTGVNIPVNASLRGDIGMFRLGSHAGGDTLNLTTPDGSIVGGFLVSQDIEFDAAATNVGIHFSATPTGETLNLGANSDLRFFDTPRIDLSAFVNHSIAIPVGGFVDVTDDAGGQVRFSIIGGNANTTGLIRVIPISGSLGVAIGRIEVNLDGGAQLVINSLGNPGSTDVVSIGRIVVTGSDVNSSINIVGQTEVDVWQIRQEGGEAFGGIANSTPRGDIVVVDMVALTNIFVGGNIGRTQVPAWGPSLIGPFLGIGGDGGGEVGGAITVPANVMGGPWNGNLYRPVNNSNGNVPPSAWMDDIGGPVSPFLNGIMVRTGNVTTVQAGGAIGDVVANDTTAGNGIISSIVANADIIRLPGAFEGIVGTIYANILLSVDIGDGLVQKTDSPLPTSGIFANDDIGTIFGNRIQGAFISSVIAAANNVVGNLAGGTDGINAINLSGGGNFDEAYIAALTLDSFWTSFFTFDGSQYRGDINQFTSNSANFLRSELIGVNIRNFELVNGFYDASQTTAAGNIDRMIAVGYRNSTISGGDLEFFPNNVTVGGNLVLLTTFGRTGDIDDLTVDVLGRIFEISANNMSRSQIDSDVEIRLIQTVSDLRGVTITSGLLTQALIGRSIRSSQISISGPFVSMIVTDQVTNTAIDVTGPDGRMDLLRVRQLYTGSISVAGPVTLIEVTSGDLIARLVTVTNQRGVPGNIATITAGRDIDLDADIGGTINRIAAGRHLGNRNNPRPIVVHGDVFQIDVANGQMYSDFRIDQRLTGSLIIGAVENKPGSDLLGAGSLFVFGSIEGVIISGDFGGRIVSYSGGINFVTINNGSLLPGGAIEAFDGNINSVVINSGHLFGSIHADYIIFLIQLNASADGVFGDMGINPALSQGNPYDALRNQLPPGVVADNTIQGPRITAGFNIGNIILTNGSIFEAFIHAGRAIGGISVAGDIRNDTLTTGIGTVIAAGSSIFLVTATGSIADTIIMAGVRSFGNDGRPGGTGANADTIQSGRIETVTAGGTGTNVFVTVGMNAGQDGVYNTGDESVVLGISYVRTATFAGGVSNASVFADSATLTVSPGVVRAGNTFVLADPDLSDGTPVPGGAITPGVPFAFNLPGGISGLITFTGPGQAYYDAVARKVILINTSLVSTLLVQATGTLTDFDIVTNDDASMGSITVANGLAGDSDIVVDAYCLSISIGDFSGTGSIKSGMNLRSLVIGNFTGGFITAAYWVRDIVINGSFGNPNTTGEARIDVNAANSITINGAMAGLVNVERDLSGFFVGGAMNFGQFRAGGSVGAFTVGSMNQSRVSVGNDLGVVTVNGDATESQIQAGGDLGADAAPGGTGFNADRVSTGNIGSVRVVGNFARSSVVAGLLRGPDIYFGTADDAAAAGRSNIGSVTITGNQVGSNLGSESFRVSATGSVGVVTLAGQIVTQVGNFRVEALATRSNPLRVQDLVVGVASQTWSATVYFNQAIDASTVPAALSISEVRNNGQLLIPLVQGVDYTIVPTAFKDRVLIQFSRAVTDRDLVGGAPALGLPGPGIFRFTFLSSVLRATVSDARLDADPATSLLEDYSQDAVVGDAGDKLVSETINNSGQIIDMYGPVDLTQVLDNNLTPDGLPDPNVTITVRGVIGDHPDHGITDFRPTADTDIYQITLRAGQILRMGAMQGAGFLTFRGLFNAAGQFQFGATADTYQLPTDPGAPLDLTLPSDFLIKTTGTYFIVVGNFGLLPAGIVPDATPGLNDTGDYNFALTVFDDGDSGFNAATDSGNGTPVVNAPAVLVFAGPNQVFQNPGDPGFDDLTEVVVGDYTFTLDAGPDGTRGTADDIVSGTNRAGITSTRAGSNLTSVISSAIGPQGHSGVPGDFASDVDVFILNNGQTIAPGRTITVKIKLADIGADLGSFSRVTGLDFRGDVQFGIFDITGATGIDDGLLLASPNDFKSIAQREGIISQQGGISYGYDANGDFFFTFLTTGRVGGVATDPAVYAIYLQGVFNTDYTIEVTQNETAPSLPTPQNRQNVFIETRGGTIDWLEAGGITTVLAPYSAAVLGFTGTAFNGQNVGDYILSNLVSTLNGIFAANGLDVVFSTDPGAFEFQPFSTVFLSASTDPITVFNTANFGYSQHSDPFNSDLNDEAAVFLPSFSQLGYTPAQADLDNFVLSLTAAVGRRVGELVGLRIEADVDPLSTPVNIMAANSVFRETGQSTTFAYGTTPHALSVGGGNPAQGDSVINTNFFLGQQNAFALLDKFLTP
jgi:hypothetical protein